MTLAQTAQQSDGIGGFFANYGLILLLIALLVFMFWSSRRRMQKQKLEQESKARQTVPGAEVLLQGGLYGTVVSYDAEDLDAPAIVEIAPGVEIKVHSQAVLRIVNPSADAIVEDEYAAEETSLTEDDQPPAVEGDEAHTAEGDEKSKPEA